MLVITGGIRTDLGKRYQLHEIDQHAFMKPLTKATFLVARTPTWCRRCSRPGASPPPACRGRCSSSCR
jgi:thiamine pyrophosphate-dependent acetolactate synthase large subunit-like protein